MMASSVNATTFNLFKNGSTTKLSASVGYDAASKKATLNPTNNLRLGTRYKAVVSTGAKDLAGQSPGPDHLHNEPGSEDVVLHGEELEVWTHKVAEQERRVTGMGSSHLSLPSH